MPDYGVDFRSLPTFDWGTKSGASNLLEAAYWRLVTPRGALSYDPDYGLDLRQFVQRPWNPSLKYEMETLIAAELEKDPRIERAFVDAQQIDLEQVQISIRIRAEEDEEFTLVIGVNKLTLEVLRANA